MNRPNWTFPAADFRRALMSLPVTQAWESLDPPELAQICIPSAHAKALSPDHTIVEGMRGAGKSFWTAVLADDNTRRFVADTESLSGSAGLVVRVGFGLDLADEQFPTATRIGELLGMGQGPDAIWRAVLLRHAFHYLKRDLPFADRDWTEAVRWVADHPGATTGYLTDADRALAEDGKVLLLLFDSLERLADDWGGVRRILAAALKLGLECRTRRAIRCKFFLRPDMVEEEDEVWRFADSSKLLHAKAKLDWRPDDLYGVILLHLLNSPSVGAEFRRNLEQSGNECGQAIRGAYRLPRRMTSDSVRAAIEALAGPWVGASARRGYTYTWITTHLADAKGRLSPRSILLAFRQAAEWTDSRQREHSCALHYQGVQQGVVEASKIRISEIKEDYPWVDPLLRALHDTTVPLSFDELSARWTQRCIDEALAAAANQRRLPPRRYSSDPLRKPHSLVDDLVELAVLYQSEDRRRFNMPDIFRVGFGIKRKGGVRPPR